MADVTMSLDEYLALLNARAEAQLADIRANPMIATPEGEVPAPKKRKVSAYSREFGRQYRALRKKHPRMAHGTITKKAHAATRKIRKK